MNLNGAAVRHVTFGEGTILDHTGSYLFIDFAEGRKEFPYPGAFCKHIKAIDPTIAALIEADVVAYQSSEDAIMENNRLQMAAARKDSFMKAASPAKGAKKKAAKPKSKPAEEAKP